MPAEDLSGETAVAPDGDHGRGGDRLARARALVRQHGGAGLVEIVVNFAAPFLVYSWAKPHMGEVQALMLSSLPPMAWSLVEFARRRRVDTLSLLVVAGIVLSLLAYLGGGSVRLLQLREKLVTVLIGLAFLGSAAIGRPLIFYLARAGMVRSKSAALTRFEARRDDAMFRRSMMIMTLVWGFGLVGEAAASTVLVFSLSVKDYLLVSPVLGNAAMGGLALWTFWYVRHRQRAGDASRAAAVTS